LSQTTDRIKTTLDEILQDFKPHVKEASQDVKKWLDQLNAIEEAKNKKDFRKIAELKIAEQHAWLGIEGMKIKYTNIANNKSWEYASKLLSLLRDVLIGTILKI